MERQSYEGNQRLKNNTKDDPRRRYVESMANIHIEGMATRRHSRAAAEKGNPIPLRQGPVDPLGHGSTRRTGEHHQRESVEPSQDGVPKENMTLTTQSLTNPHQFLSFHSGKWPGMGGRVLSSTSREESDALRCRRCRGWTNQPGVSPGPRLEPPTPCYQRTVGRGRSAPGLHEASTGSVHQRTPSAAETHPNIRCPPH